MRSLRKGAFTVALLAFVCLQSSTAALAKKDGAAVVRGQEERTKFGLFSFWPFKRDRPNRSKLNKAIVGLGSREVAVRNDLANQVFGALGDGAYNLLTLIELVASKIDSIPFIGEQLGDLIEKGVGDNALEEFGADSDLLLNAILKAVAADSHALTSANVTDPHGDYAKRFESAYAWPHELFPGVVTNGYDPTLKDGDVMFLLENRFMNELFESPSLKKAVDALWMLQGGGVKMTPNDQGVWGPVQSSPRFNAKKTYHTANSTAERYARSREMVSPASLQLRELYDWTPPHQSGAEDPAITHAFDDAAFSKLFFAGIGQNQLRGVDGSQSCDALAEGAAFVAPLDYLSAFEVKDGAGKYGGNVYFDATGFVSHIVYNGQRYDAAAPDWEVVKRNVRGSLVAVMTAIDHLLGVHLHYSNSLAWATPRLPRHHPLRSLLWGHIFNANGVNRKAAAALSLPGGLFARAWALTGKGLLDLYEHVRREHPLFQWMTVPQRMERQNMGGFPLPYHQDGRGFYDVLHGYVRAYLELHYASDAAVADDAAVAKFLEVLNEHAVNKDTPMAAGSIQGLADVLASYLFHVTGFHTFVGSMHHEAVRPGIAPSMWYMDSALDQDGSPPNSYFWRKLTFILTSSLRLPITGDTCSTEQRCGFREKMDYQVPLPANAIQQRPIRPVGYPEFFPDAGSKTVNQAFVRHLLRLQEEIVERNKARYRCDEGLPPSTCRPFNAFDVSYVENGVAI